MKFTKNFAAALSASIVSLSTALMENRLWTIALNDPWVYVDLLVMALETGGDWKKVLDDYDWHALLNDVDDWTDFGIRDEMKCVLKRYSDEETAELRRESWVWDEPNPSGWSRDEMMFHMTHEENEEYLPF